MLQLSKYLTGHQTQRVPTDTEHLMRRRTRPSIMMRISINDMMCVCVRIDKEFGSCGQDEKESSVGAKKYRAKRDNGFIKVLNEGDPIIVKEK